MSRVLISGGEGDLASALKLAFSEAGYEVCAPGRAEMDVRDALAVKTFFEAHVEPFDLVICNAGITQDDLAIRLKTESFEEVLITNLAGSRRVAIEAVRRMEAAGCAGHILFVGSISSSTGPIGQVAYASSKAALHGLCHSLASEWGELGIRVNVVWPGFLETKMTQGLPPARVEEVKAMHCLGRLNEVQKAAEFMAFLNEKMLHTSGQIFNLDSRIHRWS